MVFIGDAIRNQNLHLEELCASTGGTAGRDLIMYAGGVWAIPPANTKYTRPVCKIVYKTLQYIWAFVIYIGDQSTGCKDEKTHMYEGGSVVLGARNIYDESYLVGLRILCYVF